ncbi:MAG TPA: hydrogenase maturation protease [Gemmatimonadales bacterium]|jgi:hydrogenase maturation protease
MNEGWQQIGGERPGSVTVDGIEIVAGSRVQLLPRAGRDIFDLALAGRQATVESLELDTEGGTHLVVTVDDDPARDFRDITMPGHRFYFRSDEVVPVNDSDRSAGSSLRVLVAGIGNIFMADDGFGVEVARALLSRPQPACVDVVEYGIRGMDLAYAMARYGAAILVDAAPRGVTPGTIAVLDPSEVEFAPDLDTHGMDPVKVIGLAKRLGAMPTTLRVVVCEPAHLGGIDEVTVGLSVIVAAAVPEAVNAVESLIAELLLEVAR